MRTERLYKLVEALRATAPRPRTVPGLAAHLGVSERTVQRDLQTLTAAGVPVRNCAGRGGGWYVDASFTLPPVSLNGRQALTFVVALAGLEDAPVFDGQAREAVRRIAAGMSGGNVP